MTRQRKPPDEPIEPVEPTEQDETLEEELMEPEEVVRSDDPDSIVQASTGPGSAGDSSYGPGPFGQMYAYGEGNYGTYGPGGYGRQGGTGPGANDDLHGYGEGGYEDVVDGVTPDDPASTDIKMAHPDIQNPAAIPDRSGTPLLEEVSLPEADAVVAALIAAREEAEARDLAEDEIADFDRRGAAGEHDPTKAELDRVEHGAPDQDAGTKKEIEENVALAEETIAADDSPRRNTIRPD